MVVGGVCPLPFAAGPGAAVRALRYVRVWPLAFCDAPGWVLKGEKTGKWCGSR